MRLVFMGTPDFAVPALAEIAGAGHEVVAVYTRAPSPAGRGMDERPTPVHELALRLGLPVMTPKTLRSEEVQAGFRALAADAVVVVAYGLILPTPILRAPALGCLNLHASLLPRWRGAAPIQRAIMAGDRDTGVAVMGMEEGLDTGPVALVERIAIPPDATAGDVHDRLARLGADVMARALAALSRGALRFTPQPQEGVTYAGKIGNDEARLDWSRPARELHDHVRGLSPHPGAFAEIDLGRGPERVKVLRSRVPELSGIEAVGVEARAAPGTILDAELDVACADGGLRLERVQRAGRGPVGGGDFLRGARLAPGSRFL